MGFLKYIHLNSFTIGAGIPALFYLFSSFFLLSIKKKSKATLHLALGFALLMIFLSGYVAAASIYHPIAAFHRWITAGIVLFSFVHFDMFYFYFPIEKNIRFARIYLIARYAIALILVISFFYGTYDAPKIFNFNSHIWDFDEYKFTRIISIAVLLSILCNIIVALWRFIILKTKERWIILFILLAMLCGTLIPGVANGLSRDGIVDRDIFQFTLAIFNVLSAFIILILYVNNARDRISFLGKLISITGVVILITMQFISYFLIQDKEKSFDREYNLSTVLAIKGENKQKKFRYLISYSIKNKTLNFQSDKYKLAKINNITKELINTFIYESIKNLSGKDKNIQIIDIFNENNLYTEGYKYAVIDFIKTNNIKDKDISEKTIKFIDSLRHEITINRNKIKKMNDKNFRQNIFKYLSKSKVELTPFKKAIEKHCKTTMKNGAELKEEVLKYLTTMNPAGTRNYRLGKTKLDHYVSFMYSEIEKGIIYEAGYSYVEYRNGMHAIILKIIITFLFVLFAGRYGFQFFFSNILIKPLRNLTMAVREVEKGNLTINIPVLIEDEIGYVTYAFNKMVNSIKTANKKLQEDAETLEEKVKDRTEELEAVNAEMKAINESLTEARNNLWGEMQLAKRIQTVLLPRNPKIKGYEILTFMKTADEVGGDYYDIINTSTRDWIIIGDVSGHGVPAGLIMMMVQSCIRSYVEDQPDIKPSKLLENVNKIISHNIELMQENKFMTITAMAIDQKGSGIFSGRHEEILVYRKNKKSVETIKTDGICISPWPLGKNNINITFSLEVDDVVMLYTDGITEAWKKGIIEDQKNPDLDMYGKNNLIKKFEEKAGEASLEEIKNNILKLLDDYDFDDDITLLLIRRVE